MDYEFKKMVEKLFKGKYAGGVPANLSDFVQIPEEKEYFGNPEKLALIQKYKEMYQKSLKSLKTIGDISVVPQELHDYKDIYLELLTKNFLDEDSSVSFDLINAIGSRELDIFITTLKMDIYINHVVKLKEDTMLHLVSLSRVAKFVFLSNAKKVIANEFNNLYFLYLTFANQEVAMKQERNNFKNKMEQVRQEFNVLVDEDKVLEERFKETEMLYKAINPGYEGDFSSDPELLIAWWETELEMYVYKHKEQLSELRQKVQDLTKLVEENFGNLLVLKETYIEKIQELELHYKIFGKYGRNLVSKEDIDNLYRVKFAILTINIEYDNEFDITNGATFS